MTEKSLNLLRSLHLASVSDPGYLYTTKKDHKELAELGFVSVDGSFHDSGVGFMRKFATGITESGINFLEKELGNVEGDVYITASDITLTEEKGAIMNTDPRFTFEPVLKVIRYSTKEPKYPFDDMPLSEDPNYPTTWTSEVGPDVVKGVQSAVGAANRKWSEETGETKLNTKTGKLIPVRVPTRKFSVTVRYTEENEPYAKVQRVL